MVYLTVLCSNCTIKLSLVLCKYLYEVAFEALLTETKQFTISQNLNIFCIDIYGSFVYGRSLVQLLYYKIKIEFSHAERFKENLRNCEHVNLN